MTVSEDGMHIVRVFAHRPHDFDPLQVDIITAQGSYTEKDAAAAVRTMLEVRQGTH